MPTVQSVEIKKKGVNERTGKEWIAYAVTLDDGRVASGFNLVKVGDLVEVEQKGDFLNYFKVKPIPGLKEPTNTPVNAPGSSVSSQNGQTLDIRQRAIIRQHSQSMALELLKLKLGINSLNLEDLCPGKLKQLADYFDNDVLGASNPEGID